jgi:hypothetical protein
MKFERIRIVFFIFLTATLPAIGESHDAAPFQSNIPSMGGDDTPPVVEHASESKPKVTKNSGDLAESTKQPSPSSAASDVVPFQSNLPSIGDADSTQAATPTTEKETKPQPSTTLLLEDAPDGPRLAQKIKHRTVSIILPLDYTAFGLAEAAADGMRRELEHYGKQDVKIAGAEIENLTLEEFRKLSIRTQSDIIFVTLIKPEEADVFIYDRRTPYYLYTADQNVPKQLTDQLSREMVLHNVMSSFNATLKAYVEDKRYEIARSQASDANANRSLATSAATQHLLITINKELASSSYVSLSMGGACGIGTQPGESRVSTFNILSAEAGTKISKTLYLEADVDLFSYNSIGFLLKYISVNVESPMRFGFGLGPAFGINRSTVAFDPDIPDGAGAQWIMGSASLMIPTLDVYLKIESKIFIGLGGAKDFFSLSPGIAMLF